MKKGDIILVSFPFTDLTSSKRRPAVIISNISDKNSDAIIAFISSVIKTELANTDLLIDLNDPDFKETGLLKASVIKTNKLLTIDKSLIIGEIGKLSNRLIRLIDDRLKIVFDMKN